VRRRGQLLERRARPGFEQDLDAQNRYQGEREPDGVTCLAQQKVDDGRDDQHDGHRVEEETDDLSNPPKRSCFTHRFGPTFPDVRGKTRRPRR
jgi:hypothetical protein